MKKSALLFISPLFIQLLFAQEWVKVTSELPAPAKTTLISSDIGAIIFQFDIPGLCDGKVNNSDKNDMWKLNLGNTGYNSADFNMDGMVDMTDKTIFWKTNAGRCSCIVK